MLEDPALFVPLLVSVSVSSFAIAFWLWIPRLLAAIVSVQLLNLWTRFHLNRTGQAKAS